MRPSKLPGLLAIAALVFAQAVFAAHACDDLMPACHRGADDSAACAVHCAQPVPSTESASGVAILPWVGAFFALEHPQHASCPAVGAAAFDASLLRATSPPAIRDCRLRF